MFNDLEAHKLIGGAVVSGGDGWKRPSDWLEMPTVSETEEKFVGLFAVYDTPENFIALSFEGDYAVDWGDGNAASYSGGQKAQHSYVYDNISLDTESTEGYRQVLVTVTPFGGDNLTRMDLSVKHDTIGEVPYPYSTNWLDLIISLPNASTGKSIVLYDIFAESIHVSIQQILILNSGSATDFDGLLSYCFSLKSFNLGSNAVTNMANMFYGCFVLTTVPEFDTSSVTNMSGMFGGCLILDTVPLFNTSLVTDMSNMFCGDGVLGCFSLTTVPLFDTSSVTEMGYMFGNCYSLNSVPLFDTSSVLGMVNMFRNSGIVTVPLFDTSSATDMGYMFSQCFNLATVPEFNMASAQLTGNMFESCIKLQTGALNGTEVSISYQDCLLGRQAIVDIFNGLATVSGKTINISNNYGVTDLTQSDLDIAINKGWTIIS